MKTRQFGGRPALRRLATIAWLVGFGGISWGQATGGGYELISRTVGGGGLSSGGEFELRGAVLAAGGGPSTGVTQPAGMDFGLVGGVFGPLPATAPRRPVVKAVLTSDKLAELTWDVDVTGFVLEFAASLAPDAVWQPVDPQPTGFRFVTPCQQPARFFRFRER